MAGRPHVIVRSFPIEPIDGRRSFYGKARALVSQKGWTFLKSYDTVMCGIDRKGNLHRLSDFMGATTRRHVKAFLAYFGKGIDFKRDYLSAPVDAKI